MERKELRGLVVKAMADAKYNTKDARAMLVDWAESNPDLQAELIFLGADQVIRDIVHSERHVSTPAPTREERAQAERDTMVSPLEMEERVKLKAERRLFWDRYALFGHLPLREATRPELHASVDSRTKQAEGNLACADFEKAVARQLKSDTAQVKHVLKNDALLKLARKHDVI